MRLCTCSGGMCVKEFLEPGAECRRARGEEVLRAGDVTFVEAERTDEQVMIDYLNLKVRQRDWHAVADAAMDLREMEARGPAPEVRIERPR